MTENVPAPGAFEPIQVTALDATSIEVSWVAPPSPNQPITRYEVFRNNQLLRQVSAETTTINDENVRPSTTYSYFVRGFNDAGSSDSEAVSVTTEESAPSGVAAPSVTVISAEQVRVTWSAPSQPNGQIISYSLLRDGNVVCDGLIFSCSVDVEFATRYSFRVEACTREGCAISTEEVVTTAEIAPEGQSAPTALNVGTRSARVSWTPPANPNGVISKYELYVQGLVSDSAPFGK